MIFAETSTNEAITVLSHFLSAVETFGWPLQVQTDYGGENTDVCKSMVAANGEQSVIVGSSVRNQQVERFNFYINANITRQFTAIFRDLEFEGSLNAANNTDLFCLQYIYTPRVYSCSTLLIHVVLNQRFLSFCSIYVVYF